MADAALISALQRPAPLSMTNRQEATVIAALRLWHALLTGRADLIRTGMTLPCFSDIATDCGLHDPLTPAEVEYLLQTVFLTD